MPILVFPDTNILMEYKSIREIDWRKVLGVPEEEIGLVIAPQVTTELGQHKSGKDARKRERAKRATRELERYEESSEVPGRPGVIVILGSRPPSRKLLADHNLEWDDGDSHIIGSMHLVRKESPDARIVLVSDDVNHRQRAKGQRFEAVGLPEEYEQPSEPTQDELKLRKLEEQVRQYEDSRPKLRLVFLLNPKGEFSDEADWPPLRRLDPANIESEYHMELHYARSNVGQPSFASMGLEKRRLTQFMDFQRAFDAEVKAQALEEATFARTLRMSLAIRNDGLSKAHGIRAFVSLPEGVEAVNRKFVFPEFKAKFPQAGYSEDPWPHLLSLMPKRQKRFTGYPPYEDNGHFFVPPTKVPDGRLLYEFNRDVPYDFTWPLGLLDLTFAETKVPESPIQIHYEIRAEDLIPKTHRLLIRFQFPDEPESVDTP